MSAPKVPKASAEKSILSVASYVIMTSGQCTIGAITNVKLCLPVENVSPSLTICSFPVRSMSKNCPSMVCTFALHTMVTSGYRVSSASMV